MSQMPINIQPVQPAPSGSGGGDGAAPAKGGAGFDQALRSAVDGGPGRGPGTAKGAGSPGADSGAPAQGEGAPVQGRRPAADGGNGDTLPARPGLEGRGEALLSGGGRGAAEAGLVRSSQEGGARALEARLLTLIRDLMGGAGGRPKMAQEPPAPASQEAHRGAGQAGTAESGGRARLARLATLLAGREASGQEGDQANGGQALGLRAESLLARLGPSLSALTGGDGGSEGLKLTGGAGAGAGSDRFSGLLQALNAAGGRGEGGTATGGGQTPDGGAREFGNRLAGAEAAGREAGGRGDTATTGQAAPGGSRPASASGGVRVVAGQHGVPQAMVQVAKEAADGQRDVRLQLNPPNLGQVRVELQMSDQRIQAVFHVDNRHAASLLDGQMNALRNALQDQQLDLEDAQVQVAASDADDGQDGPWDQGEDDRRGRWTAWGGDGAGEPGDGSSGGGHRIDGGLSLYA